MKSLRQQLVSLALKWQKLYGVAPHITSALSEVDAAKLIGMKKAAYSRFMIKEERSQVAEGFDFKFKEIRYQVKANRPSGKKGSKVTVVSNIKTKLKKNNESAWDKLIWILYDSNYEIQEAWRWDRVDFEEQFKEQLSMEKNYVLMTCEKGKNSGKNALPLTVTLSGFWR
ncbi:MAG: hypothetical protein LBD30_02655 [Verrucomicrobiales bacterium]|jgi:hypothetical protein|nr:hypothetical protein [Verrucomicrobiales bacterium]